MFIFVIFQSFDDFGEFLQAPGQSSSAANVKNVEPVKASSLASNGETSLEIPSLTLATNSTSPASIQSSKSQSSSYVQPKKQGGLYIELTTINMLQNVVLRF